MATKPTKTKKKTTAAKTTRKPKAKPVENRVATPAALDAVAKALTAGKAATALSAALEAWRAARAPALADLIDTISAKLAAPPIASDLEWTKVAVARDPLVLGPLLASVRDLPVSFLPTVVQKLDAFPDDPRIAAAARDWILDPPTQSSSTYPFWTGLYKLLERLADARVIAAIDERLALPMEASKQFPDAKAKKPSQFWGKFYAALEKTRAKLEQQSPASVDRAAIAKLGKLAGTLKVAAATTAKVTGGASTDQASRAEAGPPLARALAHATAGRVPETIAALLEAWRDKRAAELADLIDRATRLLPSYRATFPVEPKAAHTAWHAALVRDPAGELPRLVRHLHAGGAAAATEHVVALSTLPDDPRIASRLAEIANTHTVSPERAQFWKTSWELIARTRDVRVIAPLRQGFADFTGTYYDHHRSGRRLVGPFVLAEPPPSPLDAADFKLIGRVAAALDKHVPAHVERERMLLADIVAHWDDEGPRLVYADWLIQQDHLRGHLIVLACKQAREGTLSASEQKQLRALRGGFRSPAYLHGPISDFEHVLDRGLPTRLEVNWRASQITMRHLAGDLMLPLLDVIDLAGCHDDRGRPFPEDLARVMLDPTATRLVRVTQVPNESVDRQRDPRFEMQDNSRLADALEPLVKAQWKRDGRDFLRR